MEVTKNRMVSWVATKHSLKTAWRFRGAYHLHLQGQRVSQIRNQEEWVANWLGLLLYPEDGGDMFL
jgi:hypothetical protein